MDYTEIYDEEFPVKDRTRAKRRKKNLAKAMRKCKLDASIHRDRYSHPWYNNLHQYSKNKIHCSCLICAFNGKKHGRVVFGKILPMGDKRRLDVLKGKEHDYLDEVV